MVSNLKNQNPPDLSVVLDEVKRDLALSINCVQIGIIRAFNSDNQTADIEIAIRQVESISEDGTRNIREYPMLGRCPVTVLYGGVDYISFGISEGDNCIVFFNDRQIDNWFNSGSGQAPTVSRVHDLSDGIALVGLRPLTNSIEDYLTNGIRLSHADQEVIEMTDDMIRAVATLFLHDGNVHIAGGLRIDGNVIGDPSGTGQINFDANITQEPGREIHAGNGATGTFTTVTVVDGIVTGGS